MADKKKLELADLIGKPNHEILALALAGDCDGTIAALAMAENDKKAKAELTAAQSAKAVNIAETRLQKDGKVAACPGKPLTGFQACRILSEAARLVAIMRAEFKAAGDKVTEKAVECRAFGKKDEKVKVTQFHVGGLLVATDKPAHVEFVRKFLADFKA